jgi:hypothetical protein
VIYLIDFLHKPKRQARKNCQAKNWCILQQLYRDGLRFSLVEFRCSAVKSAGGSGGSGRNFCIEIFRMLHFVYFERRKTLFENLSFFSTFYSPMDSTNYSSLCHPNIDNVDNVRLVPPAHKSSSYDS